MAIMTCPPGSHCPICEAEKAKRRKSGRDLAFLCIMAGLAIIGLAVGSLIGQLLLGA